MTDTEQISPVERPPEQERAPQLTLRRGHNTFLIGLHFKTAETRTVTDKIKHLIRKEVQDGGV